MPSPSDREYWTSKANQVRYIYQDMKDLRANDPQYQSLDRQRTQIMDEADAAGVYLPDYAPTM